MLDFFKFGFVDTKSSCNGDNSGFGLVSDDNLGMVGMEFAGALKPKVSQSMRPQIVLRKL